MGVKRKPVAKGDYVPGRVKPPENMAALARHFGLSRVTISYILNGRWQAQRIGEQTARKVLSYVSETGFQPNQLGLALRGKSIKDIAIVIPAQPLDHHKDAYFRLLDHLEKTRRSYLVLPVTDDKLGETVRFLKMYRVKQLLVFARTIGPENRRRWLGFLGNLAPAEYLLYDFPFESESAQDFLTPGRQVAVGLDRLKAHRQVMTCIWSQGYRHALVPQEQMDNALATMTEPRQQTCTPYSSLYPVGQSLFQWGEGIAREILPVVRTQIRSAVFIPDDKMSQGAIRFFLTTGLRLPEELGIISWDGLLDSEYYALPLTTLVIPHSLMLAQVFRWLDGEPMDQQQILEPHIRPGTSLPERKG